MEELGHPGPLGRKEWWVPVGEAEGKTSRLLPRQEGGSGRPWRGRPVPMRKLGWPNGGRRLGLLRALVLDLWVWSSAGSAWPPGTRARRES